MRYQLIFFCAFVLLFSCRKQNSEPPAFVEAVSSLYDSTLKPFYHGVASGDPLTDAVILWTRVTPPSLQKVIVTWEISSDKNFSSIIQHDTTSTDAKRDFTVKVDVRNLAPGQYYYYRFHALGTYSPIGRTKTASSGTVDSVRFAVVSCANWEFGFFNAYDRIAERELDAVIHLGDYIYEYASGKYGDTTIGRLHIPGHEIVSLQDYRTRYSQYHVDAGLRRVRQMHPFITIWDDHEVANDAYTEGAQNHQPDSEGNFLERKEAARKAYYEWIPIREGFQLYRSFRFGTISRLIMLDERLEGRTKPVDSITAEDYLSEKRTMLGKQQLNWLEEELKSTSERWHIIGNQVLFSKLIGVSNPDSWDGYPVERNSIMKSIRAGNFNNVIFITGDTHASWAIESMEDPAQRKASPFAIELGTTSISSGNGNEYESDEAVISKEKAILKANPHVKYLNRRDHGYLLITLSERSVKSEWWYVETLRQIDSREKFGASFTMSRGQNKLR